MILTHEQTLLAFEYGPEGAFLLSGHLQRGPPPFMEPYRVLVKGLLRFIQGVLTMAHMLPAFFASGDSTQSLPRYET